MRLLPFDYATRNLARSWPKTVLGASGSLLVVMLIIAAAAFIRGMSEGLSLAADERNVIILGIGSEESVERSEVSGSVAGLIEASVSGLAESAGVLHVSPEVHVGLPLQVHEVESLSTLVLVRGITPRAFMVHDVQLIEGRLPVAGRQEVVVGGLASARMGLAADDLAIGKTVRLDGEPWSIVGRFTAPGSVIESEIWTSLSDLKVATRRDTDSCVVVTLGDAEFEDIDIFCRQRLDLELTAIPETEYYARLVEFFEPVQVLTWITAILISLGGFFGGLNTLYAAFAARIREFGMLQCLGYRRIAVIATLVQESLLVACAGGLAAAVLSLLVLDGLNVRFSMGVFRLSVDATVIAAGLCAGLSMGIIGALPPAWRCLRLPLAESLKAI